MLNLKKTAMAVLVLGSSAAFAGSMGPVCSSVNVTVPCESSAWGFGAEALYLEPTSSSGDINHFFPGSTGRFANMPNKWNWGFKLEGSYHYGTGSDTNLNWYHINKASSKTFPGSVSAIDLSGAVVTTPASTVATGSTDPKWDAVNLEFGQHVNFGENKSIRFHGGAQYARIANSSSKTLDAPGVIAYASETNRTYNGFGPRVGADMNYDWGNGLGIYANAAGSILVGTSKLDRSIALNTPATGALAGANSLSATKIVPEMDTKLGIKYDYAMAQGDLTLDLGWMWVNYFNAHTDVSLAAVGASSVSSSDFGIQGLYFGLKWLGNVA